MKRVTLISMLLFILVSAIAADRTEYFIPVWSGNGYQHMNFYVLAADINGDDLEAGDEIAVFDGEYCVGAVQLITPIDLYVSIIASMNDPLTPEIDGYTPGNPVTFKIWDVENQTEYSEPLLNVEYVQGEPVFQIGATSVVNIAVDNIPHNIEIHLSDNTVLITWDAVEHAISYRVYSSTYPYGDYEEETAGLFLGTSWTAPLTGESKRFYHVRALFE